MLKNAATEVSRTTTTNAAGFYNFPNLEPETYELIVQALGFSTQVRTNVVVTVGAKLVVNVVMQTGDPRQVVRVALSENAEREASVAVSGNVNADTVRDSPLNGRDWTQLAALQAGVTGIQTGSRPGLARFWGGNQCFRRPARPEQLSLGWH